MTDDPQPPRKLGVREYIGGFALMAMGFGVYSWTGGRDIPWEAQRTGGAVLFSLGLLAGVVAWLWPRTRD